MDGHKLWNEFLAYHSLASSLTPQSLEHALTVMWNLDNYQTMLAAYPLIASLLARTVERFMPECNQWEEVVPMKQPRTAVAIPSLNHKVYAIGGECVKTPRETHY